MMLAHSLISGRGSACLPLPRNLSQKSENIPSCVPDFHQFPAFTLFVSKLCLSGSTVLLYFISGTQLGFKTLNFRDTAWHIPRLIL